MTALAAPRRPRTATTLYYVPVALNVVGQVNGGGMQTAGPGTARWIIDGSSIRGEDGSGTDRGGGPGVTAKLGADGSFFASNILLQSALAGARMMLNASVPIEQIIDGSGVVRAEFGNLGANGVSAAGYKMRANDASGSPVFDSDGLIAVMNSVANATVTIGNTVTGLTWTAMPTSTTGSFSVARQGKYLMLWQLSGKVAGAGVFAYARPNLGGNYSPDKQGIWDTANGYTQCSGFLLATLAAGSYTASVECYADTGSTLTAYRGEVQVFRLGS